MTLFLRNRILNVFLLFVFILINACDSKKEQDSSFVYREYYDNGNVKGEISYNKDSLKHGIVKLYHESGTLWVKTFYFKGKQTGIEEVYFESGQLKTVGTFLNDLPIGEFKEYHENGELKLYDFYNPGSELEYRRFYSEEGSFVREEGVINFHSIKWRDNTFTIGDELVLKIYTPTPPDINITAKASIRDHSGKVLRTANMNIKDGKYKLRRKLASVGKFKLELDIKYVDSINNETFNHQPDYSYTVKK